MTIKEAVNERHSVRQYKDIPIEKEKEKELRDFIEVINDENGLDIQFIVNDPECFDSFLAHYGKFTNVQNYIAMVGNKQYPNLDETMGYFGEEIVLKAQTMGLNTCWVAGTFSKKKCKAQVGKDEKLLCVISIGYGENQGQNHKSKPLEKLCKADLSTAPEWFKEGVEGALKAPTALNQQKFVITLEGEDAKISSKGGAMTKIDLGIVKYNFEVASGRKVL
ncbi:MAG: nitroreductase family protein [Lachnospiraceae bacterium]|nr:nitroreductase family protein [Lachnospiraceae bacterium]MBR4412508.1 nitroreductase family protein [Lachnospiraceae bacterium]MBR5916690.1 nitroreductase family protein [Lachnospiraceae bacterium]